MSPETTRGSTFGWVIAATLLGAWIGYIYTWGRMPNGTTHLDRQLVGLHRLAPFALGGAAIGAALGVIADVMARHLSRGEAVAFLAVLALLSLLLL